MREDVYVHKVLPLYALSIFVTFVSSLIGILFFLPALSDIVVFTILAILSIILVIILSFRPSFPLMIVFNVFEGLSLSSLLFVAGVTDPLIIPEAFGCAALIFTVFSLMSWKSKYNFLSWGKVLFILLIVALAVSIVQIFIQYSWVDVAVDVGVIVLFIGYILYDTQNILRRYPDNEYINACVALYLDFINIFVRLIDILLGRRRERAA